MGAKKIAAWVACLLRPSRGSLMPVRFCTCAETAFSHTAALYKALAPRRNRLTLAVGAFVAQTSLLCAQTGSELPPCRDIFQVNQWKFLINQGSADLVPHVVNIRGHNSLDVSDAALRKISAAIIKKTKGKFDYLLDNMGHVTLKIDSDGVHLTPQIMLVAKRKMSEPLDLVVVFTSKHKVAEVPDLTIRYPSSMLWGDGKAVNDRFAVILSPGTSGDEEDRNKIAVDALSEAHDTMLITAKTKGREFLAATVDTSGLKTAYVLAKLILARQMTLSQLSKCQYTEGGHEPME